MSPGQRVVVAFGLAAALQLTILPLMPVPGPDLAEQAGHGAVARHLHDRGTLTLDGRPTRGRPPLYPIVLAPLFALADPLAMIQGLQVLLVASTVWPLALFLRRADRSGPSLEALLLSILPPAVALAPYAIGPEALFVPLVAWWLVAGRRALEGTRTADAALWGAVTGLALLTEPAAIRLAPLLVLLLPARRGRPLALAAALAAVALVAGPWIAREVWVWRELPAGWTPEVGASGAAVGVLLLGSGVFFLPAAMASGQPSFEGRLLLGLTTIALALGPAGLGPCPLAAVFAPLVATGVPALGRRAVGWHAAAAALAAPLVFAPPIDAIELGSFALDGRWLAVVPLYLLGSAVALARLGARRTIVALAVLALLLPTAGDLLGAGQVATAGRPTIAVGRWLERVAPDGPFLVAADHPALSRAIEMESGRLPTDRPSDAVLLLSPEELGGRRVLQTFRLGPDGPVYHLYGGDDRRP